VSSEVQLISGQLELEHRHCAAVARACAGVPGAPAADFGEAPAPLRQACMDYLVLELTAFEERDQRLADHARAAPGRGGERSALAQALGRRGSSREALTLLEAAVAGRSGGWREFADFCGASWSTRREAIAGSLGGLSTAEWRALSGIDADSIVQERQAFARVAAALPAGISLEGPAAGSA
jgi:hypothetical protein